MSEVRYLVTEQDLRTIFRKGANIDTGESMVRLEDAVMDAFLPTFETTYDDDEDYQGEEDYGSSANH